MAVFKFSNVGGFGTYQRYNDFLAGNPAVVPDKGSMFPLGVFTLASSQASITFSNIPQTYKHLHLRGYSVGTAGSQDIILQLNGVTSGYSWHELRGNGATAVSNAGASTTFMYIATNATDTSNPVSFVGDILDYSNTNKNKTFRVISGRDMNGSGTVQLISGAAYATTAVTSITINTPGAYTMNAGTNIALYGINA